MDTRDTKAGNAKETTMTIHAKEVTRRGNAVGRDKDGRIVVVSPRRRCPGKPTPWTVHTERDGSPAGLANSDHQTFATKAEACAYASVLVTTTELGW